MYRLVNGTTLIARDVWPVVERFVHDPAAWLPAPAERTADGRWRSTLRVGMLSRDVTVEVGPVWELPDAHVRPVRWWAVTGHAERAHLSVLLPSFTGNLKVRTGSSSDRVRVELEGHYKPPLGHLGTILDAVALRRVADATATALVRDVAANLGDLDAPVRQGVSSTRR